MLKHIFIQLMHVGRRFVTYLVTQGVVKSPVPTAEQLGFPVALKVDSPGLSRTASGGPRCDRGYPSARVAPRHAP
jgi:hypothetical protein